MTEVVPTGIGFFVDAIATLDVVGGRESHQRFVKEEDDG